MKLIKLVKTIFKLFKRKKNYLDEMKVSEGWLRYNVYEQGKTREKV
jgi:hypothetical protein